MSKPITRVAIVVLGVGCNVSANVALSGGSGGAGGSGGSGGAVPSVPITAVSVPAQTLDLSLAGLEFASAAAWVECGCEGDHRTHQDVWTKRTGPKMTTRQNVPLQSKIQNGGVQFDLSYAQVSNAHNTQDHRGHPKYCRADMVVTLSSSDFPQRDGARRVVFLHRDLTHPPQPGAVGIQTLPNQQFARLSANGGWVLQDAAEPAEFRFQVSPNQVAWLDIAQDINEGELRKADGGSVVLNLRGSDYVVANAPPHLSRHLGTIDRGTVALVGDKAYLDFVKVEEYSLRDVGLGEAVVDPALSTARLDEVIGPGRAGINIDVKLLNPDAFTGKYSGVVSYQYANTSAGNGVYLYPWLGPVPVESYPAFNPFSVP
ncbi:MAG: hypothetical protein AB8H79_12270 [Myxococcota bacterium]